MAPDEQRQKEKPWQITDDGKVYVGRIGEVHMEMENRLGVPYGYVPLAEGVIEGNKITPTMGRDQITPEQEDEIRRQAKEHFADYQHLNDPSIFDFSKPADPIEGNYANERPFIVHETDEGYPEVIIGQLGEKHNNLRDQYDLGHPLLRGYIAEDGHTQVEVGDEQYLPLVEKKLEAEQDEDPYPNVHAAASVQDGKWAYLNGDVGFGQFHHQILDTLGEKQNIPAMQKNLISNLALANAQPASVGHDVAWGAFHGGYPVFWRTNVDRNHIWDAVQNARRVVEPPQPVTAGLKEMSELDIIKESITGSGGQLVEVQPGGQHLNYDGQLVSLPPATTTNTPQLDRTQTYYAANVEKGGDIIGSVSVEVEANSRRNGDHWQEVVIHDAYVKPEFRGSDVWMQLYRWLRQHWPNERFFGEFANDQMAKFFEKDNRRNYLGDDGAWSATGIGDSGPPTDAQPEFANPGHYAATEHEMVEPIPGLGYFSGKDDVTDEVRAGGHLQIDPSSREPVLYVNRQKSEPPGRGHGTLTRVNAFSKGDWRWGQKELPYHKIISVEHGPHHYYSLKVNFNGPVHLRKYEEDPTLRPTSFGELEFGKPLSTIRLRGREHPVYDGIDVNSTRAWSKTSMEARAPWYIGEDGVPVIGNWNQFHSQIGGRGWQPVKGDVNPSGQVRVFNLLGHPHPDPEGVVEQITPHLRRAFGFGFHPTYWPAKELQPDAEMNWDVPEAAPVFPEAPQTDSNGLRARIKGLASAFRRGGLEGVTEPQGQYLLVGAQPGEAGHGIENPTGMPHKLENGEWASWSGWPDAYRFISDGTNYMEQPESVLMSGHGFGHPGMNMQWREQKYPQTEIPWGRPRAALSGWHIPMQDGTRGIKLYQLSHAATPEQVANIQAHIEHHHGGPARLLPGDRDHNDPNQVMVQHPHGKMIQYDKMPASPDATELNFDHPAPPPGVMR